MNAHDEGVGTPNTAEAAAIGDERRGFRRASEWDRLFGISPWERGVRPEIWNLDEKAVLAVFFGATWKCAVITGIRQDQIASRARISLRRLSRVMHVLDDLAGVVTRCKQQGRSRRKGIRRGEITTYTIHLDKLAEWETKARPREWDEQRRRERPDASVAASREHTDAVDAARIAAGASEDDPVWAALLGKARKADAITSREAEAERARQAARDKRLAERAKLLAALDAGLAEVRARPRGGDVAAAEPAFDDGAHGEAENLARGSHPEMPGSRADAAVTGVPQGAEPAMDGETERGPGSARMLSPAATPPDRAPRQRAGTSADAEVDVSALRRIAAQAPGDADLQTLLRGVEHKHRYCLGVARHVLRKAASGTTPLITLDQRAVLSGLPAEWGDRGPPLAKVRDNPAFQPAAPGQRFGIYAGGVR
jgi:hypothetical protein